MLHYHGLYQDDQVEYYDKRKEELSVGIARDIGRLSLSFLAWYIQQVKEHNDWLIPNK